MKIRPYLMTAVSNPMMNVLIRRKWTHTETHTGPRSRDDGAEIGVMAAASQEHPRFLGTRWEESRKASSLEGTQSC